MALPTKREHPIEAMVASINDQIVGRIESVQLTTAKGEDLEKLAMLAGMRFEKCPTCYPPRWKRILFFPFYWWHRRKCAHEQTWRKILRGHITGVSMQGTVRDPRFADWVEGQSDHE